MHDHLRIDGQSFVRIGFSHYHSSFTRQSLWAILTSQAFSSSHEALVLLTILSIAVGFAYLSNNHHDDFLNGSRLHEEPVLLSSPPLLFLLLCLLLLDDDSVPVKSNLGSCNVLRESRAARQL